MIHYKDRLPIFLDLIENEPNRKILSAVIDQEKQHGDELVLKTKAYGKPTSAIFQEMKTKNRASMCSSEECEDD